MTASIEAVIGVYDSSNLPEQIHSMLVQPGPKPGILQQHQPATSCLVCPPKPKNMKVLLQVMDQAQGGNQYDLLYRH